jgi:hypothetical protein
MSSNIEGLFFIGLLAKVFSRPLTRLKNITLVRSVINYLVFAYEDAIKNQASAKTITAQGISSKYQAVWYFCWYIKYQFTRLGAIRAIRKNLNIVVVPI